MISEKVRAESERAQTRELVLLVQRVAKRGSPVEDGSGFEFRRGSLSLKSTVHSPVPGTEWQFVEVRVGDEPVFIAGGLTRSAHFPTSASKEFVQTKYHTGHWERDLRRIGSPKPKGKR